MPNKPDKTLLLMLHFLSCRWLQYWVQLLGKACCCNRTQWTMKCNDNIAWTTRLSHISTVVYVIHEGRSCNIKRNLFVETKLRQYKSIWSKTVDIKTVVIFLSMKISARLHGLKIWCTAHKNIRFWRFWYFLDVVLAPLQPVVSEGAEPWRSCF